jgi:hypothetical protein
VPVVLETGRKRVFATATDWPGWCRSGRDEEAALQALLDYGPRYASVLRGRRLGFAPPRNASAFKVVEQLKGNATTDFGAPAAAASSEQRPLDHRDLKRHQAVMKACWTALDAAAATAKPLRTGPRGGGRSRDKILRHVLEADAGYLGRLGLRPTARTRDVAEDLARVRKEILDALASLVGHEPIPPGPRGGARWTLRYYVRRTAWHALDHAWEIEDRTPPATRGRG